MTVEKIKKTFIEWVRGKAELKEYEIYNGFGFDSSGERGIYIGDIEARDKDEAFKKVCRIFRYDEENDFVKSSIRIYEKYKQPF